MNVKVFIKRNLAYIFYIAALLIFGTNGVLAAHISLEGSQIVLMRTLIGGVLLTSFVIFGVGFYKERINEERVPIIFGGVALGLNWVMLFSAYRLLNVSISTLIYYAGPILVLLSSPLLLKEKLTKIKVASVFVVGIGLVCISGSVVLKKMNTTGLFFVILSAIFYAMLIIFNKKITRTSGLQTAAIELDIAFIVVLIYVLITVGLPKINVSEVPYIATIGFINTGLAYLFYFFSMQKL